HVGRASHLHSRSFTTYPNTPPTTAGFLQNEKNLMWMAGAGLAGIGVYWWLEKSPKAQRKMSEVKAKAEQASK
ncbi:hypothetical protein JCM11491_000883, partial [Sporobolomyces phaffii]